MMTDQHGNEAAILDEPDPATLAADVEQISNRAMSRPAARWTSEDEQRERDAKRRNAALLALHQVARSVGRRYLPFVKDVAGRDVIDGGVTLENFRAETPAQKSAIVALRGFAGDITNRVNSGNGLLLFGPKGTGKDHLAIACLREAARAGFITFATDGQELFQRFRDVIGSDASERENIKTFTAPDVLLLSDPIPVGGSTTDYQRSILWRIIDRRYRDLKPTWVTLNVADAAEAESKLGGQIVDRLRDGATAIMCQWPSYRKNA